ncbi:hypothetical protein [Salinisphaera hydrothermalis]|uniref:hypothetical protein n=1 Tax=Salinisphaera hydrothermalis TaxID=563188 RepID=UPI003342A917
MAYPLFSLSGYIRFPPQDRIRPDGFPHRRGFFLLDFARRTHGVKISASAELLERARVYFYTGNACPLFSLSGYIRFPPMTGSAPTVSPDRRGFFMVVFRDLIGS